ncbi:MAG: glycoside hydrolase family 47 protein [Bacteroidales bacterium]|nr:glycoside hydrolase family 47 protein [Bacteroidales bacterium]
MKHITKFVLFVFLLQACNYNAQIKDNSSAIEIDHADSLAADVKSEMLRSWNAYNQFAWGHDALKPISKSHQDWYERSLSISPIDAYSTLKLMKLENEAYEIENFVTDSLDFNINQFVKVFEVNIRILGGLLSMYELSGNKKILEKAEDFGKRLMPAFETKTGIPTYWVNLETGERKGDTVNVAEAGTYLLEMGILSRHTKDPVYYEAAKKASSAIFERRSELGLIGDVIDVESGEWVSEVSHICAGVDSYYEYLIKGYLLFGDKELKKVWEESILAIQKHLKDKHENRLWYKRADMYTGEWVSSRITLYDAFFPATLVLAGDFAHASQLQDSWNWLWNKYGLEPMVYDYATGESSYPAYDLNPEIIESAYYLYHTTGEKRYFEMVENYWRSIKKYCKTEVAYTSVKDVRTMEQKDYMPTFFFAETMKYLYLTFTDYKEEFKFDEHIFSTEAHPFKISDSPEAVH